MKIIFITCFYLLSVVLLKAQSAGTTSGSLVPVESLADKIKPDTSKLVLSDTAKTDTVYIDNALNIVKVGANLTSAYGFGFIAYERVVHYMGSLQLKLEYLGTYNPFRSASWIDDAYFNSVSVTGIGITPEFRYYGSEKYAPKGFFAGFYIPLQFARVEVPATLQRGNVTYTIDQENLTYSKIGIGFDLGYQFLIREHLSLEVLGGLEIARGKFSREYYTTSLDQKVPDLTGGRYFLKDGTLGRAFYPRLELSVGYAF